MPPSQAGVAAAVASTSRQVGVTLGVAVIGAIAGGGAGAIGPGFAAATHVELVDHGGARSHNPRARVRHDVRLGPGHRRTRRRRVPEVEGPPRGRDAERRDDSATVVVG